MRRPVLLLLCLFLGIPAALPAKTKIEKREILSEGRSRTYYLFVPERPAGAPPVPLLVTLHGSGSDGRPLVERWRKLAQKEGIVVVGPDATARAAWNTATDSPVFFHDLVEDLRRALPIDARRVYLFGHSAGAVMNFFIASMESEYFAAAVSSAGSLPPPHESVLSYATRKIPFLLIVGSPFLRLEQGVPGTVIDNKRSGAGWGAGGGWNDATPGAFPDWIQVNFKGVKTIDRAVVYSVQDNYLAPVEPTDTMTFSLRGLTDFAVQGFDGAKWVTLATVSGNRLVKRNVTFAPYATDRIRINITNALGSWSRVTEVEAWGNSVN